MEDTYSKPRTKRQMRDPYSASSGELTEDCLYACLCTVQTIPSRHHHTCIRIAVSPSPHNHSSIAFSHHHHYCSTIPTPPSQHRHRPAPSLRCIQKAVYKRHITKSSFNSNIQVHVMWNEATPVRPLCMRTHKLCLVISIVLANSKLTIAHGKCHSSHASPVEQKSAVGNGMGMPMPAGLRSAAFSQYPRRYHCSSIPTPPSRYRRRLSPPDAYKRHIAKLPFNTNTRARVMWNEATLGTAPVSAGT